MTSWVLVLAASISLGPLLELMRSGAPVLGTCAGMILLARDIVDGDVDRWLGMCDLADAAGLELIEWYVVGAAVRCPRDLVGMPPRWPGAAARPG